MPGPARWGYDDTNIPGIMKLIHAADWQLDKPYGRLRAGCARSAVRGLKIEPFPCGASAIPTDVAIGVTCKEPLLGLRSIRRFDPTHDG